MDYNTFVAANSWVKKYPEYDKLTQALFKVREADMIFFDGYDDVECTRLIIKHGQPWKQQVHHVRGTLKGCHSNSAFSHAMAPKRFKIVTGFAFDMNMWFRHSWVYDTQEDRLMETTGNFTHYYGAKLAGKPLKNFLKDHQPTSVEWPEDLPEELNPYPE
jgi:hypothetical protein